MSSQGEPSVPPLWGAAWTDLRNHARARSAALGMPTNAAEDWRYVGLSSLTSFAPAIWTSPSTSEIDRYCVPGSASVVIVNGMFRPELTNVGALPAGVALSDLMRLPAAETSALTSAWNASLDAETDVSACWCIADGGGGIRLRFSGHNERPAHILSINTGGITGAKIVIDLESNASAHLLISHVSLGRSRSSIGMDLCLHANASIHVDELQYGAAAGLSQLFSVVRADIGRDSQLRWTSFRTGMELGRLRFETSFSAPGGDVDIASMAALSAERQWHDVVRINHKVGNTTSTQLYKNTADGSSLCSFNGLVRIDRGADQSQAQQRNQNLLLSAKARVESRPQLDISADDVKANHGSTIGELDPDEVFYLRSRGLDESAARSLLIQGFSREVVDRLGTSAQQMMSGHHLLPNVPVESVAR